MKDEFGDQILFLVKTILVKVQSLVISKF